MRSFEDIGWIEADLWRLEGILGFRDHTVALTVDGGLTAAIPV